ncbi:uncharacterized protein TNCV_4111461 [Trichonephila clavipes]|nr:uncharacterized protein TNCV_4111461 [Trichonephila clavipes]
MGSCPLPRVGQFEKCWIRVTEDGLTFNLLKLQESLERRECFIIFNYLQSTGDSPLVVHHQDDEILHADDNLNKSHECVGLPCQDIKATRKKRPAERMRDYRTWKKTHIQSTSDSLSVAHQEDEILLADDNLNSWHGFVGLPCQDINATRRKTPAERMREYRRRRKNVVESELFQESKHQVQYVEESKDATVLNYSDFYRHRLGHEEFKIKVVENPFGYIFSVCERL